MRGVVPPFLRDSCVSVTSIIKGPHAIGRYVTEFRRQGIGKIPGGDEVTIVTRKTSFNASGGMRAWIASLGASLVLFAAGAANADWDLYVSAGIGISSAMIDLDGQQSGSAAIIGGTDSDQSPLIDGAFGLRIPMDEIFPREWLKDIGRLPTWPMRFELEAAGLRDYELRGFAGSDVFFTTLESTTTFVNIWQEIPLTSVYRPVQYTLGLGRQPRIRNWLAPASIYFGAGVGFSDIKFDGTSNAVFASDDLLEFAWNAGVGFNYSLTDAVDISAGYRYVGLSDLDLTPTGGAADPRDDLQIELDVHEFRVQVRVQVFSFLSPWR